MRRLIALLVTVLALLGAAGCAHYRLGSGTDLPFRTLYVEPIENRADLAQAVGLYSAELRRALARDGRIELVASPEQAEAVLKVRLETYGRTATSARVDDTRLARKFDLEVRAVATLTDASGAREYFKDRALEAHRQIYTTAQPTGALSRQQQAEYQTQPLLARELAERTAAAVLEVW